MHQWYHDVGARPSAVDFAADGAEEVIPHTTPITPGSFKLIGILILCPIDFFYLKTNNNINILTRY